MNRIGYLRNSTKLAGIITVAGSYTAFQSASFLLEIQNTNNITSNETQR